MKNEQPLFLHGVMPPLLAASVEHLYVLNIGAIGHNVLAKLSVLFYELLKNENYE